MAALDQLQRRLALAHAGIAGDQQTRAIDADEHAVAGLPGREVVAQEHDQLQLELGGFLLGRIDRHVVRRRVHPHLVKARVPAADDDARQRITEILGQSRPPGTLVQLGQIGHLHLAQQLRTLIGEEVPVVGELHARTVGVADLNGQRLGVRGQHALQSQRIHEVGLLDHAFSSFPISPRRGIVQSPERRHPRCCAAQ